MSDLVERLRGSEWRDEDKKEAADEIERLTDSLEYNVEALRRADAMNIKLANERDIRVDKWMQLMVEKDERIEKLENVRAMAKTITDGSMIRSAYWELELRAALQEVDDG